MPFTEQDKTVLSDIIEAFSLAIVEVCETYEHQNKLTSKTESGRFADRPKWQNETSRPPKYY